MKKTAIILTSVLVGVGALVAFVLWATSGPADAADQFLLLCGAGKTHDAYLATARPLRATQDEAAFAREVARLKLGEHKSASWSIRRIENDRGFVDGTVTTRAGGKLPLSIALVKERGAWRVLSFSSAPAAAQPPVANAPTNPPTNAPTAPDHPTANGAPGVPSDEAARKLTTATLAAFDRSLETGDFTPLLGVACKPMREQYDAAAMKRHFQEFLDNKVRIAEIEHWPAIFTLPPGIDEEGLLLLAGFYPSPPPRVWFRLRYLPEPDGWKLAAINVYKHTGMPFQEEAPPPDGAELERTVRAIMTELVRAAQKHDFTTFHSRVAALWQTDTTPAELAKTFASFSSAPKGTVEAIGKLPLVVDASPKFVAPGVLEMIGHYDTKPPLHFGLKFVYEHPSWKLFGIKAAMSSPGDAAHP
jgi:hypothetical protein